MTNINEMSQSQVQSQQASKKKKTNVKYRETYYSGDADGGTHSRNAQSICQKQRKAEM